MLGTLAKGFLSRLCWGSQAAYAAWPECLVTLIVPYAAGGITDVLVARTTAEYLQTKPRADLHRLENETGGRAASSAPPTWRAPSPTGLTLAALRRSRRLR